MKHFPEKILVWIFLSLTILCVTHSCRAKFDSEQALQDYSKVVDMIANGELTVEKNGWVKLPKELSDLSRNGECVVSKFDDQTAVHFIHFQFMAEAHGYLLVTDKISYADYVDLEHYSGGFNYSSLEKIAENIYRWRTD